MKFDDMVAMDTRAEQGAWIDTLRNLPGVAVKVRGEMNADYERLSTKLWANVPAEKRDDDAVAEAIETEILVETVLLGWTGIEDMEFSKANAEKMLKELRVFRQGVLFASRTVAARGKASLEADAKNS